MASASAGLGTSQAWSRCGCARHVASFASECCAAPKEGCDYTLGKQPLRLLLLTDFGRPTCHPATRLRLVAGAIAAFAANRLSHSENRLTTEWSVAANAPAVQEQRSQTAQVQKFLKCLKLLGSIGEVF